MACHHLDQTFLKECNHLILPRYDKRMPAFEENRRRAHLFDEPKHQLYKAYLTETDADTQRHTHTHTGQQTCWALPVV